MSYKLRDSHPDMFEHPAGLRSVANTQRFLGLVGKRKTKQHGGGDHFICHRVSSLKDRSADCVTRV